MARYYRVLISVPITAEDDDEALRVGAEYAHSLPPGKGFAAGHLELVGEVRKNGMEMVRPVHADPAFLRQLPPDWKP
jgi:hypothetical protein